MVTRETVCPNHSSGCKGRTQFVKAFRTHRTIGPVLQSSSLNHLGISGHPFHFRSFTAESPRACPGHPWSLDRRIQDKRDSSPRRNRANSSPCHIVGRGIRWRGNDVTCESWAILPRVAGLANETGSEVEIVFSCTIALLSRASFYFVSKL